MHVEYDTEADALYVSLCQYDGRHHARPLDDRRIIHVDDDGSPVGVELLFVSDGIDLDGVPDAEAVADAIRSFPELRSA